MSANLEFRTVLCSTKDGARTFGVAYVAEKGAWKCIGETNKFRVYPQDARTAIVRAAATAICRRYATAQGVGVAYIAKH